MGRDIPKRASDPERCHAVGQTIRQVLAHAQNGEAIADLAGDGIEEAEEGRVITALHRRYGRNSALVQAKKRRALAMLGKLACEACGFDFRERYGATARASLNVITPSPSTR
jgi:5-methylcytosine-specific restriction protein A